MSKSQRAAKAKVHETRKLVWLDIVVLPIAAKEGWDTLTPGQYLHIKDQIKQLVGFARKQYETNLTIEKIGEFWELKDKGGTLGRKNMRVYFKHHNNEIVVLSTYKKEDDGKTPRHIQIKIKNRWSAYLKGAFQDRVIRYKKPKGNRASQ